jgi:hypothetical protein
MLPNCSASRSIDTSAWLASFVTSSFFTLSSLFPKKKHLFFGGENNFFLCFLAFAPHQFIINKLFPIADFSNRVAFHKF